MTFKYVLFGISGAVWLPLAMLAALWPSHVTHAVLGTSIVLGVAAAGVLEYRQPRHAPERV